MQNAESRKQKAESRMQKAESRKQKAESRKQNAEIGSVVCIAFFDEWMHGGQNGGEKNQDTHG